MLERIEEKSDESIREQKVESCCKYKPGELFLNPLAYLIANYKCGGIPFAACLQIFKSCAPYYLSGICSPNVLCNNLYSPELHICLLIILNTLLQEKFI